MTGAVNIKQLAAWIIKDRQEKMAIRTPSCCATIPVGCDYINNYYGTIQTTAFVNFL
jgi:hypothetical protein